MNPEYQEIDLIDLFKKVLKQWWLIVLLVVVCAASANYYTKNYITPTYMAKTTLFTGKEGGSIASISFADLQIGNQLVTDYRELIKTEEVLNRVKEELSLNTSTGVLKSKIGISIISDSRFIYITVVDPVPVMAAKIADTVSEILQEKAIEVIGAKNIQIVDYALVPTYPIGPNVRKNTMLAAMFGAALAIGVIFLGIMLRNTVEKEEDIELAIGVPVIGIIPKFKGEVRK